MSPKSRAPFSVKSSLAVLGALNVLPLSQAVVADEIFRIEEIVVVAQKREQSLQEVPIAIDAFTSDDIKSRSIDGAADLGVQSPSFVYGEVNGQAQLSIRGVGFVLLTGAGENSVAVHSDGLYLANPGAVSMLQDDIAGLELLKGPQGTLWGRNATAGVVNFITHAPAEEVGGHIKVGLGNFDAKTLSGSVDLPISERVKTRFSLQKTERDGFADNHFLGKDINDLDKTSGRVSVDIDVSDELFAQIRAFGSKEEINGSPHFDVLYDNGGLIPDFTNPFAPPTPVPSVLGALGIPDSFYDTRPYDAQIDQPTFRDSSLSGGSLRLTYDLSENLRLVSITGMVDYESDIDDQDLDGTAADLLHLSRVLGDETWSQEFNLSGEHGDLTWLLGAFYMQQDIEVFSDVTVPLFSGATMGAIDNFIYDFEEEVESIAVFADATYNLNDNLNVYAGIRAMQEERDSLMTAQYFDIAGNSANATVGLLGLQPCNQEAKKRDDDDITGRLGLQWMFGSDSMVYAQVASGFKSGGAATSLCGNLFEPETIESVEVGFKTMLMDGQLRLNGAAFFYDYSDIQVEETIGSAAKINNADGEILGAELDLLYYANPNLQFNAGLTLLDTEYTEFNNVDAFNVVAGPQDLSGNPLLRSPEWQVVVGGQYTLDLSDGASLMLRADINSSASYQLREFDLTQDEQNSYTMVNASLTYTTAEEDWVIRVWGKNLTDEEVLIGILNSSPIPGAGYASGSYGMPATYGATAEYNF